MYAKGGHLTDEVKYMGGIVGGGLLVLISALFIHLTGKQGCCGNRFGMLFSVVFAAVGAAGAVYCFIVALLGLGNGPLCKVHGTWTTPFKNRKDNYLTDYKSWETCTEPKNVVLFNIGLFGTLAAVNCLQVLLCAIQVINGLVGCLCGTGNREKA